MTRVFNQLEDLGVGIVFGGAEYVFNPKDAKLAFAFKNIPVLHPKAKAGVRGYEGAMRFHRCLCQVNPEDALDNGIGFTDVAPSLANQIRKNGLRENRVYLPEFDARGYDFERGEGELKPIERPYQDTLALKQRYREYLLDQYTVDDAQKSQLTQIESALAAKERSLKELATAEAAREAKLATLRDEEASIKSRLEALKVAEGQAKPKAAASQSKRGGDKKTA